jgi:hypothetical protein
MWIDRHQPRPYQAPSFSKGSPDIGKATAIWHDQMFKLMPIIGPVAMSMLNVLIIHAKGGSKGGNTCTVANGVMMNLLKIKSPKTFRDVQKTLLEWHLISFSDDGAMSEYEIRDPHWVMEGIGLLAEKPTPIADQPPPREHEQPAQPETSGQPRRRPRQVTE